jgi:hypothetical protein
MRSTWFKCHVANPKTFNCYVYRSTRSSIMIGVYSTGMTYWRRASDARSLRYNYTPLSLTTNNWPAYMPLIDAIRVYHLFEASNHDRRVRTGGTYNDRCAVYWVVKGSRSPQLETRIGATGTPEDTVATIGRSRIERLFADDSFRGWDPRHWEFSFVLRIVEVQQNAGQNVRVLKTVYIKGHFLFCVI